MVHNVIFGRDRGGILFKAHLSNKDPDYGLWTTQSVPTARTFPGESTTISLALTILILYGRIFSFNQVKRAIQECDGALLAVSIISMKFSLIVYPTYAADF